MRSRISSEPSAAIFSSSTPWNWSTMPRRSPTICIVAPAPRDADSQPPKTSSLDLSRPGMVWMASANAAATSAASVNPLAGPSSATNSNGTFCATVIITCWSFAFGPRLTSQTLLRVRRQQAGVGLLQFRESHGLFDNLPNGRVVQPVGGGARGAPVDLHAHGKVAAALGDVLMDGVVGEAREGAGPGHQDGLGVRDAQRARRVQHLVEDGLASRGFNWHRRLRS